MGAQSRFQGVGATTTRWLKQSVRVAAASARDYRDRLPRVRTGGAGTGTVYFLTPDFDRPAGGLRVFYRHVDTLNAAGVGAAILHSRRGFSCSWFEHTTRIADIPSTRIGASDLLVVPEIYAALLPSLPPGVRHVIFNQGPFLTFTRAASAVARHYATSPDLLAIMTVSRHGAELLSYAYPERDVRLVRNGIDPAIFHPGVPSDPPVLTYMPRRGREDAELTLELLRARGALDGWEIRALEGLSQAETADALRASTLFLSFAYQEGFGLPPAEAMACGNLVAGFHGMGGEEFFLPAFSRPVPTGDVLALARAVEQALAQERRAPGSCRALGLEASRHVHTRYSPAGEREDLLEAFAPLVPAARAAQLEAAPA